MAVTLANTFHSDFTVTTATGSRSVTGCAWSAGSVITVWGVTPDNGVTLTAPTNANLTFTSRLTSNVAGRGKLYLWTAVAASAQTAQTIAGTVSTGVESGYVVRVYDGASGVGTVSSLGSGTTGAASVAYTIASAGSVVDGAWVNWNQITGARTYRTTNLGAATEDHYYTSGTFATTGAWHNAGTTATGSQTIGMTAPTLDAWLIAGIEILAAGGTSQDVTTGPADGTGAAPVPAVSAGSSVAPPAADGTGAESAPSVAADSSVSSPAADSTGAAPVPSVSAGTSASVDAVAADGTGTAPAPALNADSSVTAPPADGAGDAQAPAAGVTQDATVQTPAADGTGTFPSVDLPISSTVTTGPASGTGDMPAPTVSGTSGSTVQAVPADGAGDAPAPTIRAGASVPAPPASGSGDAPAPTPTTSGVDRQLVDLGQLRAAEFLTPGATGAAFELPDGGAAPERPSTVATFEQPAVSATFEQAEAEIT